MKAIHFVCHAEGLSWRGLHRIDGENGIYYPNVG